MRWESLRELRTRAGQAGRRGDTGWTPSTDVSETDTAFIVVAELPGVQKADVEVAATADSLTIRGQRCGPGCEPAAYVRVERGHGPFVRRFSFQSRLDVDAVQADFRDGVLTVTLPKVPEAGGRRVEVG